MSLDFTLSIDVEVGAPELCRVYLFDTNATHNLIPMWSKAGVYEALYRSAGRNAGDIIETLQAGLNDMIQNPYDYRALNPENGWGTYEEAVIWLTDVLNACIRFPLATIHTYA